jgi:hypothetical protein
MVAFVTFNKLSETTVLFLAGVLAEKLNAFTSVVVALSVVELVDVVLMTVMLAAVKLDAF